MKTSQAKGESSLAEEDAYKRCNAAIRQVFGEELPLEKIAHYTQSADGNITVALNQILNDLETSKLQLRAVDNNNSNTNPLEKIISDLAEELKCPICLNYFESPVVLRCHHTFCYGCAEELAKDKDCITCPLCRSDHPLNGLAVSSLPTNRYIQNIAEKVKSAQISRPCEKCSRDNSNLFCSQCNLFLCTDCDHKHHIQQIASHKRQLTEEMFLSPRKSEPPRKGMISEALRLDNMLDLCIPFYITKEVCSELFQSWAKGLWFAPTDLGTKARMKDFKAMYLPYWMFEVDVTSRFSWLGTAPISSKIVNSNLKPSNHKIQVLISASKEFSDLLKEIEPWKINQIRNLSPKMSENVTIVPFALDQESAEKSDSFRDSLDQACRENYLQKTKLDVELLSPSVTNHMNISNTILRKSGKKVFVPIYVSSYEYHGKKYHFIVNGSTAKCFGQRPYSPGKLISLGFTGVSALGLIAGARSFTSHSPP